MKRSGSPLRTGDIASLFLKHAAKKKVSFPSPSPTADWAEEQTEEHVVEDLIEASMEEDVTEEILSPTPPFAPPLPVYDINRLPQDSGERLPIADYPVNDQDAVRRAYILKGPHQNYSHAFKGRLIGDRVRQFSPFWFHQHHWLEYSPKKEAAYCFVCYLFKEKKTSGKGTNAFTESGWSNWNKSDEDFHGIENLVDLSVKLVETRRHIVHNLVYLLLKLVLILPVATANVERAFSAMNLVKNKLRNKMGDSLLDDCLVTYIERDTFSKVDEEDIIETFMAMRRRKPIKK